MKYFLRKLFSLIGLRVTRTEGGLFGKKKVYTSYKFTPSEKDKYKWLRNLDIKTIIDVGAHKGEAALQFHSILPNAALYCFEPLRDIFKELSINLKDLPHCKCFNVGLGNQEGQFQMNRSSFTPSSSLMKMAELHKTAFPFTSDAQTENINVTTLDSIAQHIDIKDNVLLKIDVQGYEDRVLLGAINTLTRIKVIIIETSFCELYDNQPLFSEIYALVCKLGFKYSGKWAELNSPLDGRPLQQDAIFLRDMMNE